MVSKLKCREKGISDLLPWYVTNNLPENEMVAVEHHIAGCSVCREELERIKWISDGFSAVAGKEKSIHINAEMLTIYSESKKELTKERIRTIEDHLSTCKQCAHELEILIAVNQSLVPLKNESVFIQIKQKLTVLATKTILRPAFAYVLVLLLLYPAWLGLFRKISGERIIEPVNIENLYILEQNDQRAPEKQVNQIILHNHSAFFTLSFVLPIKNQKDFEYEASINNTENKIIWQNKNLKFVDPYGTVILICPQKYFSKGTYFLHVIEKQKQANEVMNKYMFTFEVLTND
jgi:hypothetical protein